VLLETRGTVLVKISETQFTGAKKICSNFLINSDELLGFSEYKDYVKSGKKIDNKKIK